MRFNNRKKTPIYQFFFTASILLLGIGLLMSFLHYINIPVFRKNIYLKLIYLGIVIYVILYLRGRQIFEYDSDGEAINFKNYSVFPIMKKEIKDEFPKYKLISYDIVNAIIFKRLYVKIYSKKKKSITLSYDISYLTSQEVRELRLSLRRTIKKNNEQN